MPYTKVSLPNLNLFTPTHKGEKDICVSTDLVVSPYASYSCSKQMLMSLNHVLGPHISLSYHSFLSFKMR